MTSRKDEIINLLKSHIRLTCRQIANYLNLIYSQVYYQLCSLSFKGEIVRHHGPTVTYECRDNES